MRNSQSNLPYVELYVLNREELMKLRKDHSEKLFIEVYIASFFFSRAYSETCPI